MSADKKKKNKKKKKSVGSASSASMGTVKTGKKSSKKKTTEYSSAKKTKGDHTVHAVLPRRQGMGLATKLTFFVVILLAGIIVSTQLLSYNSIVSTYNEQLNKEGAAICSVLIKLPKVHLDITELDTKRIKTFRKMIKDGFPSVSVAQEDFLRGNNEGPLAEGLNLGTTLSKFSNSDVVQIFWHQGSTLPYGKEKKITPTSAAEQISIGKGEVVTIEDGILEEDGESFDVRTFDLVRGGWGVKVCLNNEKIKSLKTGMRNTSIVVGLISLVLGVLGVSLLAHQITKPIGELSNDMVKVARGSLGHLSRVNATDEIGVLAKTFNLMSKDLKISHDAELVKIEQDRDLELARSVQISLVPTDVPQMEGYSICPFYRSAKEVGGDYYDIVEMDEEHTAFFVADVSGKGVQGAMIMAMTRGIAHSETMASRNFSPAMILSKVNVSLARDLRPGSFVTAMCLIVNKKTGLCKLASAGHNPLIVVRHKTKQCETFNPTGIALGFDKGPLFNKTIKESSLQINLGDRVILYTDGVPEAMDMDKKEYGMARFLAFSLKYTGLKSDQFMQQLVNDLDRHKGKGPQHDDITAITLRKLK